MSGIVEIVSVTFPCLLETVNATASAGPNVLLMHTSSVSANGSGSEMFFDRAYPRLLSKVQASM